MVLFIIRRIQSRILIVVRSGVSTLCFTIFKMRPRIKAVVATFLLPECFPTNVKFIILEYSHHLRVTKHSVSYAYGRFFWR
jgi:hypothetical protein